MIPVCLYVHMCMFTLQISVIYAFELDEVYVCLCACVYMYTYRCLRRPEKKVRFPEAGLAGFGKPLIWVLGTELGFLQDQVLLTAEPSP